MGTLTDAVISTTYKKLVFQKTDNKFYYTNASDVDTELTTFASKMIFTLGAQLTNNILYNSAAEETLTLDADQGVSLQASKSFYTDIVAEKTSANGVVIDSVTCKDGNIKLAGNVIQASDGGSTITLDTSDNVTVAGILTSTGDLVVNGGDVTIKAGNDDGASILMQADNSDDAGDDWKVRANSGQTFTVGNDIASAGSFVTHFTITPHATIASSYVTIPGSIRTTKLEFTDGDDALTIADAGHLTTGGNLTTTGNIIIPDSGNIGSASDTDALAITSSGQITVSQYIVQSGAGTNTFAGPATFASKVLINGNTGPANGAGIDTDGSRHHGWIEKIGGVYKTSIYIDLAGLASTTTDKDVIGLAAGGVAHIGNITSALNGAIFAVKMTCLEAPTTGADDIDLYNADEGTYIYDNPLVSGSSTEYLIVDGGGAWTNGEIKGGTTITFGSSEYLYLVGGEAGTA